jgi:hypothetical protein
VARKKPGGKNSKKVARAMRNRVSGKYARQRARTEANKARRNGDDA